MARANIKSKGGDGKREEKEEGTAGLSSWRESRVGGAVTVTVTGRGDSAGLFSTGTGTVRCLGVRFATCWTDP